MAFRSIFKYLFLITVLCLLHYKAISQCPVVINEVMVTPIGDASANSLYNGDTLNGANPLIGAEWIELFNMDPCHDFDIGCYLLASATSNGTDTIWGTLLFAGGTIIPAGGHILIGGNAITNADFTANFYTNSHWCSSKKWALDDQAGWVGLYNLQSNPVSAVYWTQNGTANNLQTDPQFNLDVNTNLNHCTCCSPSILPNAKNFPGIEYAGNVLPNSNKSIARNVDGSNTWVLSSIGGTPGSCNGGIDSCYFHDAEITFQSPVCVGGSDGSAAAGNIVTGIPNVPYTYHWSNTQNAQTIQNISAGTYSVTITDKWGCSVTDTVNVPDPVAPNLNIINNSPVCEGTDLLLSSDMVGLNYNWSGPDGFMSTTPTPAVSGFEQINSGLYSLILTDSNNCTINASVQIDLEPLPMVNLGSDTMLCAHQNITFHAGTGNNYTYFWSNGTTAESIAISGATQINIQNPLWVWVAVGGCKTVYDSVLVNLTYCEVIIPNVFTPNGDSYNDFFEITGIEKFPNSELQIFNRWGKKVYENANYQNNWNGENLPDGVYYYILNLATSPTESYHGEITLLGE